MKKKSLDTHPQTNIIMEKTKTIYPLYTSYTGGIMKEPQKLNQRTSGLVNAHLTPGPAFIHVYSPRAGADKPLGTNVDVNRKPLSLCPFVASVKTISLKHDFKHILNDFIHDYIALGQGQ